MGRSHRISHLEAKLGCARRVISGVHWAGHGFPSAVGRLTLTNAGNAPLKPRPTRAPCPVASSWPAGWSPGALDPSRLYRAQAEGHPDDRDAAQASGETLALAQFHNNSFGPVAWDRHAPRSSSPRSQRIHAVESAMDHKRHGAILH